MSELKLVKVSSYIVNNDVKRDEDPSPVANKIWAFHRLPAGWHFGEGRGATSASAQQAVRLSSLGLIRGFKVDAFPELEGGVIVKFYRKEFILEVNVSDSCDLSIVLEKGHGQHFETVGEVDEVSTEHVITLLEAISAGCDLYELFTPLRTTQTSKDLTTYPLRSRVMESLYSTQIAPREQREACAIT